MVFVEPSAGFGHNFADKEASWIDFIVTKSNPSGTTVRFTVADPKGLLTTQKMVRSVIGDAINQWIVLERADLDTNGDGVVKGSDTRFIGDGFASFTWDKAAKFSEVILTSTSSISVTGDLTVSKPYADVA